MKLGVLAFTLLAALSSSVYANEAAPVATPVLKSSQTSGVTVSISKALVVDQKKISLQLVATNNTKTRIYLMHVLQEEDSPILSSGEILSTYGHLPVGVQSCDNKYSNLTASRCLEGLEKIKNLSNYSYIEPSDFFIFGFSYEAKTPVSNGDTISFPVTFIARFAKPDGDPAEADAAKVLKFNFPATQLEQK